MKRSGFWFQTLRFQEPPPKLHFWMTKKDPCLPLNLFKSWSNLGFDQYSNGHKNSKKSTTKKPKHIAFLCHIMSIQVDKHGLLILKQEKSCIYPRPNRKLDLSYEVKHEEKWFWVSNIEISRTPQKLHFWMTKKDPFLPLNLFKSWSNLGFDQDSNGHKIQKK